MAFTRAQAASKNRVLAFKILRKYRVIQLENGTNITNVHSRDE